MIYPEFPIETYIHHRNRYLFADNMLPDTIQIFDFGCGTGYGTDILRRGNRFVIGFDKNHDDVEYAKEKYKSMWYFCKNIVNMNYTYTDAVVMFECLEHLTKKDALKVLDKINHFVNYVVLSTPKAAKLGINRNHKSQWTVDKLKDALYGFDVVSIFGQDWSSGQILYPFSVQTSMYIVYAYKKKEQIGFGAESCEKKLIEKS